MTTNQTLDNAQVLRTVTVNTSTVEAFKSYVMLKAGTRGANWWPKAAGQQPSDEALTACVLFGKQRRVGPESGFIAMQWREGGASLAELAAAFSSGPAHNHTRNDVAHNSKGEGPCYCMRVSGGGRFYLTFTVKGVKYLEKLLGASPVAQPESPAKPKATKPKATGKPRKGKVKAPETVPAPESTVEPQPAPVDQPQAGLQ